MLRASPASSCVAAFHASRLAIQRSEHQILIANNFWLLLSEKGGKKVFHIILMRNQQITMRAVAARLVEREEVHWVDMNDQWQFSLVHLAVTLWALRPSHILIGIEKEAVLRGLFAKLYCGFLFSIWHGLLLFLDKDN